MELENAIQLARDLKALFPEGARGVTTMSYAGNTTDIYSALRSFLERYPVPGRTDEEKAEVILEATKKYIKKIDGNNMYVKNLEEFIIEFIPMGPGQNPRTKSRLATWIEDGDKLLEDNLSWGDEMI